MSTAVASVVPTRAGTVLSVLILGAFVSNVNLAIANVALPDIGRELNASQAQLTVVASAFAMALAATVLYLGAIGDRYGRKLLCVSGAALTIPASMLAAWSPTVEALTAARIISGVAAGLLFPTTLSMISALWAGPARTKAIALWSGIGAGAVAIGTVLGGLMLENFWWGSVFLIAVPFAVLVLVLGFVVLPWHAGEENGAVDHIGGVLSIVGIGALIAGIQHVDNHPSPTLAVYFVIAILALGLFLVRQMHAPRPLIDLDLARHRTFWVAALSGTIAFGSLLGAMFIGQQFTQNILGYDTLESALTVLPASACLLLVSPLAAQVLIKKGGRYVLTLGITMIAIAFIVMWLLWKPGASVWSLLIAYAIIGTGVAFAVAAATRALMGSVPISRAGMGSAFTDLTRDFGGAIMQAIMGTVLAIGYTDHLTKVYASLNPSQAEALGQEAATAIESSFSIAEEIAKKYPPPYDQAIVNAASDAFSQGKSLAFILAIILVVLAGVISWWKFPHVGREMEYYREIADISEREMAASAAREAAADQKPPSQGGVVPAAD